MSPSTFSISCDVSGAHGFTLAGGPQAYTLDPAADFERGDFCTVTVSASQVSDTDADDPPDNMLANHTFRFTALGIEGLRIHDIQGARHRSPYENGIVSGVPGVVTALSTNGIWVQDAAPDADERTSEGIFVFRPVARPPVGTAVTFSGEVQEFKAAGWGPESLSLTEIGFATVTPGASVTPIAPTVIGQGGRIPPNRVIDNDSTGDTDTNPMFDPKQDGIDFHESLEGMLLQFNDAVATGPTNGFGEVSIIGDDGRYAGLRTPARRRDRDAGRLQPRALHPRRRDRRDADGEHRRQALDAARRGGRLLVRQLQVLPARRCDGDRRPPARGHRVADVEGAGDRDVQRREPRSGRLAGEVRRPGRHADQQPQGARHRVDRGDPGQRRGHRAAPPAR